MPPKTCDCRPFLMAIEEMAIDMLNTGAASGVEAKSLTDDAATALANMRALHDRLGELPEHAQQVAAGAFAAAHVYGEQRGRAAARREARVPSIN